MREFFEEDSTTSLVLKALVGKLDLPPNLYHGFWSTSDIAIVVNKARYIFRALNNTRIGSIDTHSEKNNNSDGNCNRLAKHNGFGNGLESSGVPFGQGPHV